jgi:hypothetical protein
MASRAESILQNSVETIRQRNYENSKMIARKLLGGRRVGLTRMPIMPWHGALGNMGPLTG